MQIRSIYQNSEIKRKVENLVVRQKAEVLETRVNYLKEISIQDMTLQGKLNSITVNKYVEHPQYKENRCKFR